MQTREQTENDNNTKKAKKLKIAPMHTPLEVLAKYSQYYHYAYITITRDYVSTCKQDVNEADAKYCLTLTLGLAYDLINLNYQPARVFYVYQDNNGVSKTELGFLIRSNERKDMNIIETEMKQLGKKYRQTKVLIIPRASVCGKAVHENGYIRIEPEFPKYAAQPYTISTDSQTTQKENYDISKLCQESPFFIDQQTNSPVIYTSCKFTTIVFSTKGNMLVSGGCSKIVEKENQV